MEIEQKESKINKRKSHNMLIITSIWITIWLIYVVIGVYSFLFKNIKLLSPKDEDGNFCGYGNLKMYDKLYLYKITEENVFLNRICVSQCPQIYSGYLKAYPVTNNEKGVIEKKYFYNSKQSKIIIINILFYFIF